MKRFYLASVSAGLALAIMSGPLAMAQQYPNHDDSHGNMQDHGTQHTTVQHTTVEHTTVEHNTTQRDTMQRNSMQHEQPGHNEMAPQHESMQQRPQERTPQPSHMQQPMHNDGYGAPQNHPASYSGQSWHNGDHYSGSREVVSDWRGHNLRQPPSGYEWVQNNGQYVMIAVASGVVASVIANALTQ